MNGNFNEQKDILISIKKEISLLHQQVDYLIRNEKPLELLDLDVMMNRTHTIYDMMCGVDLSGIPEETPNEDVDEDTEELPVGPEAIRAMFGIKEEAEDEPMEDLFDDTVEDASEASETEENEDAYFIEEAEEDEPVETPTVDNPTVETTAEPVEKPIVETPTVEATTEPAENPVEEPVKDSVSAFISDFIDGLFDEPADQPAKTPEEAPVGETVAAHVDERKDRDDFGFILNFEPIEKTEEEPIQEEPVQEEPIQEEPVQEEPKVKPMAETPSVFTTGDEIEMTIPRLNTPDSDYEIETLGDKLQQEQNPTLADKLQHSAVMSLQRSIGINDKFLFVNELFNGSMEKYNRSIENLDDLKTLNGALIYLNELRVELQWNSSNEAYKKLLELVHRKFEAQ